MKSISGRSLLVEADFVRNELRLKTLEKKPKPNKTDNLAKLTSYSLNLCSVPRCWI